MIRNSRRGALARHHPAAGTVLAADTFTRTVVGGWGTADTGGVWTPEAGTGSNFSVDGSSGLCSLPISAAHAIDLPVTASTVEATLNISPVSLPASGFAYCFLWLRVVDPATTFYRIGVVLDPSGAVSLRGEAVPGAVTVFLDTAVGLTRTAGQWLTLTAQLSGTSPTQVRAKAWAQGGAEPGWQVSTVDSTAGVQAAGTIGVRLLSSTATCTLGVDNMRATTTLTALTVPGRPAQPTVVIGDSSGVVSFIPIADDGGSPIDLYRVTASPGNVAVSSASSPITVTGLTNGTPYTFTVEAHNAIGYGQASVATAPATPATATVPAAPAQPTATGGSSSATVTWAAPSNGGSPITGYDVQPFIGATGQALTSVGVTTSTDVTGLVNGTAYTFKVRAKNAIGNGPYSVASAAVTPSASTKPGAANTGIRTGTTTQGATDFNSNGQVVTGIYFSGNVTVNASNVTFRDCNFQGGLQVAGSNFLIEWCNINNGYVHDGSVGGIIQNCEIQPTTGEDGFGIGGSIGLSTCQVSFLNNWFREPTIVAGNHVDIIQIRGCARFTCTGNNFDCAALDQSGTPVYYNSVLYDDPNDGGSGTNFNVLIDSNWINGGGYTIYSWSGANMTLTNNRFGRGYTPAKGLWYPNNTRGFHQSGNVWDDTGAAITF